MFPGGRKRAHESEKDCLRREIKEELPRLKLGRVRLWKEVKAKNRRSGRRMNDAIFVARKASGSLKRLPVTVCFARLFETYRKDTTG
jgi:8-oxo-dGTP diphosphatase